MSTINIPVSVELQSEIFDDRLNPICTRLDELEKKIEELNTSFESMSKKIKDVDITIDKLKDATEAKIKNNNKKIAKLLEDYLNEDESSSQSNNILKPNTTKTSNTEEPSQVTNTNTLYATIGGEDLLYTSNKNYRSSCQVIITPDSNDPNKGYYDLVPELKEIKKVTPTIATVIDFCKKGDEQYGNVEKLNTSSDFQVWKIISKAKMSYTL